GYTGVCALSLATDPDNPDDVYVLVVATESVKKSIGLRTIYLRNEVSPTWTWSTTTVSLQASGPALGDQFGLLFTVPTCMLGLESGGSGRFVTKLPRADGSDLYHYGTFDIATATITLVSDATRTGPSGYPTGFIG